MAFRKWEPKDWKMVERMIKSGLTLKAIAENMGCKRKILRDKIRRHDPGMFRRLKPKPLPYECKWPDKREAPGWDVFTRTGRKRRLLEDDWKIVQQALGDGMTISDVAELLGISRHRMKREIKKLDAGLPKKLHAINRWYHVKRIGMGKRNWTASAWFLERVVRKRFALGGQTDADEDKKIRMRRIVRKTVTEEEEQIP